MKITYIPQYKYKCLLHMSNDYENLDFAFVYGNMHVNA